MFCQQCGSQIPDDSKFCTSCGAPTPITKSADFAAEPVTPPAERVAQTQAIPTPVPVYPQENMAQPQNYAQPDPAYQQPAYNAGAMQAQPQKKKWHTRWPSSIGTMAIISLVFYLGALVPLFLYFRADSYMPITGFLSAYRIIEILLAIAIPVLFFTHTKKLAFLTAIPMVISLILFAVDTFSAIRYMDSVSLGQNVVLFGFEFILVILYVIQMSARPRSAALPIIYLIFSILELLLLAVFVIMAVAESYAPDMYIVYRLVHFVSSIFLTVAYCIAMFSSRKR